jgi:hypothetical protein
VKKLLPLLLVLLLLSSCAGNVASPLASPSPTPAPTPVSTPSAVVEGAEPDLLIAYDGELCGVFASTGEEIYPCAYNYIQRVAKNRVYLARYESDEGKKSLNYVAALGDLEGNLLTDFVFSYVQSDDYETGLLFGVYDYALDKVAILDAETCEPLMEFPAKCNFAGASVAADTFMLMDYHTRVVTLYSISALREGKAEPLDTLKDFSYMRSYDKDSGIGLFVLQDGSAAFFGGNGSFETVRVNRVDSTPYIGEVMIPVMVDGLWGYADATGSIVLPLQYDYAQPFSNGFAAVAVNGLFGYIDAAGTMMIEPQFVEASAFAAGFAVVKDAKGETMLIDKTGTKVLSGADAIYAISSNADMAHIEGPGAQEDTRRYYLADNGRIFEIDLGEGVLVSSERLWDALSCVSGYDYENGTSCAALFDSEMGSYVIEPGEYQYFITAQPRLNSPSQRSAYFVGYRMAHDVQLCDLIDASGNRILVGLNSIYAVGEAVAAVRKGFSWGIMDFNGNWICSYSIFNTLAQD